MPVDKYGHTVHAGSCQSGVQQAVFREFALEMCRQLAPRYGNNLTVTSWHVGNEYGWNNRHDYSEDAARAFITWCENKYGNYRCAQRSMGYQLLVARSAQLDEVQFYHMGADSMVNPSQQLDFERFGNDMLLDFYRAERDAIQSICPDKPCTTNFMISTDQCSMDYQQWQQKQTSYPTTITSMRANHTSTSSPVPMRSLLLWHRVNRGMLWNIRHLLCNGSLNARKRNGELLRDSLAHVAIGADAINFFQWRQSRFGAEASIRLWFLMQAKIRSFSVAYANWVESLKDAQ